MEYIRMGKSGLKLTEITFGAALTIGTENMNQNYADEMIDKAWELGIRSFDVSNNYGMGKAEELIGKSLQRYPHEEYIVSTKGSWPIGNTPYHKGLSRKHILWAFDESLKRMGLDYVDLYYAHRYDSEVPMEEIVRTFNGLIQSGKIRYWATSEWSAAALEECCETCERLGLEKPVLEQSIYSFAVTKAETNGVKEFCNKAGIGMLGFSPLCQGLLTGKYRNGIPSDSRVAKSQQLNYDKTMNFYKQNKDRIDKFLELCDEHNLKSANVAIQWCVRKQIYPVLGASKPKQLEDTLSEIDNEISEDIWREFDKI